MKEIKFRDLKPEEIEVRIGNTLKDKETGKPYAFQLLLYKTSRTDMQVLDETFGVFGWRNRFYQVKNTMVCSIEIYDDEKHEWINKDNGGDDDTQMEQVKSELSDSIKRAGSTLGIGRKLYTASKIYMVVNITKDNTTKSYFQVKEIEYDDTSITKLVIINKQTKEVVISHGVKNYNPKSSYQPKDNTSPTQVNEDNDDENAPIREEERLWLQEYIGQLGGEAYNSFFDWLEKVFKTRKISDLTASQGIIVVNKLKNRKK